MKTANLSPGAKTFLKARSLHSALLAFSLMAGMAQAGDCKNHVRLNKIENIVIDNDMITIHASDITKGAGFNVTLLQPFHFVIRPAANPEYKKYALSTLLSAQATSLPIVLQIAHIDNYSGEVQKVAIASSAYGLDCMSF